MSGAFFSMAGTIDGFLFNLGDEMVEVLAIAAAIQSFIMLYRGKYLTGGGTFSLNQHRFWF